jgi:carbon monoxide dehydrogenase subunit G
MTRHFTATGGRRDARRLLFAAAVLGGILWTPPLTAATRDWSEPAVTVREEQGVYFVSARFTVAQPAATVLAVLTDYEQIPRFMPGVETSIVRNRTATCVVVEQEAVSRMLMFSRRVHLRLKVHEERDSLQFSDTSRHSFERYEGAWRLAQDDDQTLVTYELTAEPSFSVPGFLLRRLLKRDAKQMIEGLRREIAARTPLTSIALQTP